MKFRSWLTRIVSVVVTALALVAGAIALSTPTASANPHAGGIVEYYQYCYDHTPTQKLTGKTGTTPKHWYKTAINRPSGVDCKYMYAGFGGFVPREKTVYYSYSKICKDIGYPSGTWYRDAVGNATCR